MKYLVDTDRVIDHFENARGATELLRRLQPEGFAISLITYAELWEGTLGSSDPSKSQTTLVRFVEETTLLPLDASIMRGFATLRADLRKSGLLISDLDLLIAATALQYGLVLVTRNIRHFQRLPNLRLYSDNEYSV